MESNYQNPVDNSSQMSYNSPNDEHVEIVKMDEQAPINDSNHEHQLVADLDDTIGKAVYHGCVLPKCGVGFYIQPTEQ